MSAHQRVAEIRRLRDEITAEHFGGFGQHNRNVAMALSHLDEAESWMLREAIATGRVAIVSRDEASRLLEAAADRADTSDTTVATDDGSVVPAWLPQAHGEPE